MTLPLYWIRSNNFGDALNPILYKFITGREPEYSFNSPKILAIGSIMASLSSGDVVWGTGCMLENQYLSSNINAKFCAVRGPLTHKILIERGLDIPNDIPYGDPASLLPLFVPPSKIKLGGVGFLPHYADYEKVANMDRWVVAPIYPMANTLEIIDKITSLDYLVTSSLHGIIVAEAYGIPAIWVELSDNVAGYGFKFRDYYSITGRNINPLNWRHEHNWKAAEYIRYNSGIPAFNTDKLLEVCPF